MKSRRSPRGDKTRDRLLTATARCLVRDGIHSLRYAQIAKQAKVPQALMGYHFPTVESLLQALILTELEKLKNASLENIERYATQPRKALEAYIRTPFEMAENDVEFRSAWTAFYHLSTVSDTFAEMNLGVRKLGRDRILSLITMVLATEAHLTTDSHLTREKLVEMATVIQGIITGFIIMAATEANANYRVLSNLSVQTSLLILGV